MSRYSSFPRVAVLLSTFALAGSIGCKEEPAQISANDYPGQMAQGYCEAVFSCPCDSYPYPSANDCFADLLMAYDALNDQAFLSGLTYDGTCPASELSTVESLACKASVPELPAGVCVPPCNAWHGNLSAGFPCEVIASSGTLGLAFTGCDQGLACLSGVCVNPCQVGGALPGIGQPCPDLVCAAGAMCDETMTCVAELALPGPGAACLNGECDPKTSVCVQAAGVCAALPTTGQPCVEGMCDANAYCGANNACVGLPPLACGLLGGGGFPGDGDGDGDTGDGDGDTGDGDGDTGDGDGDGDPGSCATETLPDVLPVVYGGDTSIESDDYSGGCGGGSGPEAKLSFTAPTAGTYVMSTEGSTFDTILYVRDSASCSGTDLACDDDTLAPASELSVVLDTGQEVVVFVDGFDGSGAYALTISLI